MMINATVNTNIDDQQQEPDNIFSDDSDNDDHENLSVHHKVPFILQNKDWNDITDMIHNIDSVPINQSMLEEARHYKEILLAIRYKLKRYNLIIRPSYRDDYFHIFRKEDFQRQASNYMKQMGIYSLIQHLNGRYPEAITQECLVHIIHRVETTLNELVDTKNLNNIQFTMMDINRRQIQLNYLYFVPETDKGELLLRPIIVCNNGPTMHISDYLSKILWSIFDRVTHCQKFSQGADAVQALELYAQHNLLHPTTLFVTFTMDDLCTVFPHQETLQALNHFLHTYAQSDKEFQQYGISIETIIQLVRLVLENQFFVYNYKLYRQTAGGASGLSLTLPLAYIYLYYWKPKLINTLMKNKLEIFGRHLNEGFLTWNGSKNQLHSLFNMTTLKHHHHHRSIHIHTSISTNVHFMDANLSHKNGELHTKIYHYSINTIEKTSIVTVPCISLCSDLKSVRKTMIRAARCCSNILDFNDELQRMELSCIAHDHSTTLLQQYIQQVFIEFHTSFMSFLTSNENNYRIFRQRIIKYEQQRLKLKKQQQQLEQQNTFIFTYLDKWDDNKAAIIQQALNNLQKEWSKYFPEWKHMKFILEPNRSIPLSASDYFVEKRPPLRLLTLLEFDLHNNSYDINNESN